MVFQDIERFLVLAECLNYTTAASKLYITQPALSTTILSLERDLRCKLFQRTTRTVALTEQGRKFYNISKAYIQECHKLSVSSAELKQLVDRVSILYDRTIDSTHLPFIFSVFKQQYPTASVTVSNKKTSAILQAVSASHADIGIVSSISVPSDEKFCSQLLFPYRLQILLWKGHPLSNVKKVQLKDLSSESFIILDPSSSTGSKLVLNLCDAAGLKIKDSFHAANFRQMLLMTSQREGISFNLISEAIDMDFWGLRAVDVDLADGLSDDGVMGVSAVWLNNNKNPAIQSFLNTVSFLQTALQIQIIVSDL